MLIVDPGDLEFQGFGVSGLRVGWCGAEGLGHSP